MAIGGDFASVLTVYRVSINTNEQHSDTYDSLHVTNLVVAIVAMHANTLFEVLPESLNLFSNIITCIWSCGSYINFKELL